MRLSTFAETGFLNAMRGQNFGAPSQVYVGLFLTDPTDAGTGAEIVYPGYARMPITFNLPSVEGSGIGIRNAGQITFARSDTDAGTVRHIGIFDAIVGGNMYLYGELTEEMPILNGEEPVLLVDEVLFFSIGNLSVAYKTRLFNVVRGHTLVGITPFCSLWNGSPELTGNELGGENYARIQLIFSAPAKEDSGISIIRNSTQVNFNRPTTNWGTWTVTAIHDAATAGEPVWWQERTPKSLTRGIMPKIEVGAIGIGIG
jgi:hypothetical protein